jgi:hypothetical protein
MRTEGGCVEKRSDVGVGVGVEAAAGRKGLWGAFFLPVGLAECSEGGQAPSRLAGLRACQNWTANGFNTAEAANRPSPHDSFGFQTKLGGRSTSLQLLCLLLECYIIIIIIAQLCDNFPAAPDHGRARPGSAPCIVGAISGFSGYGKGRCIVVPSAYHHRSIETS